MRTALWLLALAACTGKEPGPDATFDTEPVDTDPLDTDPVDTDSVDTDPVDTDRPLPTERPLADADATMLGLAGGDLLGDNVAAAGDVDGDGLADVWIGAKGVDVNGAEAGAALLFRGPLAPTEDPLTADGSVMGAREGDYAGGGLAGAGDVDGDGLDDLLIGAKLSDIGGAGGGAAWLVTGGLTGRIEVDATTAAFSAENAGDMAGGSVGGAGDVDGDGFAEILVGAREEASGGASAGAAYLVRGPIAGLVPLASAHAKLVGDAAGDATSGVTGVGDFDADGRADFAAAAGGADTDGQADAGAIWVFTHMPVGDVPIATADARIHGTVAGTLVGAVAGAGDLNGDGFDDLVVGGPGASAAWVVHGPVSGAHSLDLAEATLMGLAGEQLGFSVDGAGDFDGDGAPDLLIGALGDARSGAATGAAWWVPGPIVGTWAIEEVAGRLPGVAAGDEAGHAVAGVGDTNGDGFADVVVGAHHHAGGGAAYLVRGGPAL